MTAAILRLIPCGKSIAYTLTLATPVPSEINFATFSNAKIPRGKWNERRDVTGAEQVGGNGGCGKRCQRPVAHERGVSKFPLRPAASGGATVGIENGELDVRWVSVLGVEEVCEGFEACE
jgi:hypothetical protein